MTYDANGNLLTQTDASGTTTYTWDARSRLIAISGPTVSASFAYDALGRRTTKTINGQSTSILYDGLDTVRESGSDGDAAYLRSLAIDEALSRTDGSGTLHYLTDALGSTVALADATSALPTTYTYTPFGQSSVSGLPFSNPFQFTGRENDSTSLYYYRARYYYPTRSRFVSEDPIGLAGGDTNHYAYADGDPLLGTDPLGLQAIPMPAPVPLPFPPVMIPGTPENQAFVDSVKWVLKQLSKLTQRDRWRETCINLYVRCVEERWQGRCDECLHFCIAQQGEWPFDRCRPGKDCP